MRTPLSPRHRMMDWLARREYGFAELVIRGQRDLELTQNEAENLVQALADDGLQCDQRFAESWVRSRLRKGQGPVKIKAELRQKGLNDAQITQAIELEAPDWESLARARLVQRFGADSPRDIKEKSKRIRFLAAQGFPEGLARTLVLG